MKKILLFILTAIVAVTTYAQDTCATALTVAAGQTVVAAVNGTEVPVLLCDGDGQGAGPTNAGEWYIYTSAFDGVLTVTTDLAVNVAPNSNDTRVHIYSGTCGALVCEGGDDDVSTANYLSTADVSVSNGDVLYIAFDNRWSSAGFTFELIETPVACVNPTGLTARLTDSTATLMWTSNDNETMWNVEYGPTGFTQGTGTMVTDHSATTFDVSGLAPTSAFDFYVQANCGVADGLSTWNGPFTYITLDTPVGCGVNTPSNSFENGYSCTTPANMANDITVPMGMDMTVAKIRPVIMVNTADTMVSVDVTFFEDNAGLPGAQFAQQLAVVPTSTTTLGIAFTSYNVTDVELDLTPVVLTGNAAADKKYWISISATPSNLANNCFWEITTASVTGSGTAFAADITANPFSADGLSDNTEGVYSFEAQCAPMSTNSLEDDLLSASVKIYPTTVNSEFTIKNDSTIALTQATIYDLNGRLIQQENLNNLIGSKTINISKLSAGLYFVELNSADGKLVKKIIKK